MWQQIPEVYKGVEAWHDHRDQERLARTRQYLRQMRATLKSGGDSETIRLQCIRTAAALAIQNRRVRECVERDIFTGTVRQWRTCTPDHLVKEIWSSVTYAFWLPEEYMSIWHPWPEPRKNYVH